MQRDALKQQVPAFLKQYDAPSKDAIWSGHSSKFRSFWNNQVLASNSDPISDERCDEIVRILDSKGKGNSKGSEAVAMAMVPQNVWRRLFNTFHTDRQLATLLDSIFKEEDPSRKAELINALYIANEGRKNWFTGESGNVLNALLAAYDPVKNLTAISLKHRRAQFECLGVETPFDWTEASFGERIVQSNILVQEGTRGLGLDGSARTLSCFWYFAPVKRMWDGTDTISLPDKTITVLVPNDPEPNKHEDEVGELRESLRIQALLAEIGSEMGFQIWLPRSDRARVLTAWKAKPNVLLETGCGV